MFARAKPYLLRFHRWITLAFAVPLLILIVTGLILAFEPLALHLGARNAGLDAARLTSLLQQYDPAGKTTAITVRAYEDRITLTGPGVAGKTDIALSTGAAVDDSGRFLLSNVFRTARRLHEHFLFDQGWVVLASTYAMLVLSVLGVVMGWPRLRNSLSGWHQGVAWFGLPLVVLSPLTGLALAYRVTLAPPMPQDRTPVPAISQAVTMLAKERDLSGLIWLRKRGPNLLARINEGGAFSVYRVTNTGVQPMPANWPRALHEGNFAGGWSVLMVASTALGLAVLMITGLLIYLRRTLRPRQRNRTVQPAE
jgi:uncharacterized iron-regulated membrane protein